MSVLSATVLSKLKNNLFVPALVLETLEESKNKIQTSKTVRSIRKVGENYCMVKKGLRKDM